MIASKYRYKIEIEQATTTRDENRQAVETWTLYKKKYAAVSFKSATESEQNRRETSKQVVDFTVRFDSGINEKMRVKYETRYYTITGVLPMRGLNETKILTELSE